MIAWFQLRLLHSKHKSRTASWRRRVSFHSFSIQHMKHVVVTSLLLLTSPVAQSAESTASFVEHISALTNSHSGTPVKLKKNGIITTNATFQPPVEIVVEAKTDSTNLRLSYAADQLIFNWEKDRTQLVLNGGPAVNVHKVGAGLIPANKYVTIRWLVTPKGQSIFVNDQLRFEHAGDYLYFVM